MPHPGERTALRAPRYRLLERLPIEVVSPHFGSCRLEYREQTANSLRSLYLVELQSKREWLVHTFSGPQHAIAEYALYEGAFPIVGSWQGRLLELLVREGRAIRTDQ